MELLQEEINQFRQNILTWYATFQRPLPWRTEPSIYKTVLSEFMLQQTQVKTMLPFFYRWIETFANFEDLAAASEAKVLKYWEGLGYYSRARNLHALAKQLVNMASAPRTDMEWEQLPGIGPYTAAAISSIGFNYPAAVVDGNLVRILTRLSGDTTHFRSSTEAILKVRPLAQKLLCHEHPGTYNQAMMELGATICLKHNPLCTVCPILHFCSAAKLGIQKNIPMIVRPLIQKKTLHRAWITDESAILLHRAPAGSKRLANVYELPRAEYFSQTLDTHLLLYTGKRGISNERFTEPILQIPLTPKIQQFIDLNAEYSWIPWNRLSEIIISGPHKKWIEHLRMHVLSD